MSNPENPNTSVDLTESLLPPSFPTDDYTPHGYIDNPHHTMVLNRSGMIRSVPPLGFGFWVRKFKGTYGTGARGHVNYLSLMQLGVVCDDLRLVTADDFTAAGIELVSKYHTKHVMSYDWQYGPLTFCLRYFLPRENTLACLVEISNASDAAKEVLIHATHIYGLWEQRWWGSDSIGMRYLPEADAGVTAISAYGDYFAFGADVHSAAHKATASQDECEAWVRANDLSSTETTTLRGPGPMHTLMSYRLTVPAGGRVSALICLSRAPYEGAALAELTAGLSESRNTLEKHLDADEAFWSGCPQLDGDWPATWRHGWVYDWETLRMNVRAPAGIFSHHWDAMQVHSPRQVLGEAALDMLAMSHADPEVAKDVLLGAFADAPAANAPCCREDGSMNMVAADGQACGTAPTWCFPFKVLRAIYTATGDDAWITALYPYLKAYIDWWFEHRRDEHGWFHYHCDWESGQDGSKRFPEPEGGSADAIATVDLEASVAEALQNMVLFADIADELEDKERWSALAAEHAATTRDMFVDGWFRDRDTRSGAPFILPDYIDVMMLAPLTCRVATPEQIEAVKPRFQWFRDNPKGWLEWPSYLMAYTEAAWTAGLRQLAAEAVADIADRVYPRIDSRSLSFVDSSEPYAYRIPGIACEFWPLDENLEPGGEAYGWGATLPLYIIRDIIGFREGDRPDAIEFYLAPALPERLIGAGGTYGVRNLNYRGIDVHVRYDVCSPTRLAVTLEYLAPRPVRIAIVDQGGKSVLPQSDEAAQATRTFEVGNGQVYSVRFEE